MTMTKYLTEQHKSIIATQGCEIRCHGWLGRLLVNRATGSSNASQFDLLAIRRRCRAALESAGHDVSDLRVGIFGVFPGS